MATRPLGPKPCGEAVVIRDGEVLLMRRARDPWRGAWEVPGGFCEVGEHPAHAARRELREELGLAGQVVAYIGSWIDRYRSPDGDPDGDRDGDLDGDLDGERDGDPDGEYTLNCAYLVELLDSDAAPTLQDEEVLEVGWFALGALPERLAFPDHMGAMLSAAARLDPEHLPPLLDLEP